MPPRLHTGGRFRAWLGRRLGGDDELGDRAWRRILHGVGALVLIYYLVPTDFFVIAPKVDILLAVLFVAILLEVLRHAAGLQLPTIRPYEEHRVASFIFYAIALAGVILLFPVPIAAAVILGVAIVDPVAGELRQRKVSDAVMWTVPIVVYIPLAWVGMVGLRRLAAAPVPRAIGSGGRACRCGGTTEGQLVR